MTSTAASSSSAAKPPLDGSTSTSGPSNSSATAPAPSPHIVSLSWGQIEAQEVGKVRDAKLWPGGGREWDWAETGTRHSPGIQVADAEELLHHGASVIVLSRGMDQRLKVSEATVAALRARGVTVHVADTRAAVLLYNDLVQKSTRVAGLFHSTC